MFQVRATSIAIAVLVVLVTGAIPARAQTGPPPAPLLMRDGTLPVHMFVLPIQVIEPPRGTRPGILPVLYASFIGLEVYDGYSTSKGVSAGATESNTLVHWAVGNSAALWAVKGGAALTSIYIAERLWRRRRRKEAVALMVVTNVMMAAVAAGNAAVLRTQP